VRGLSPQVTGCSSGGWLSPKGKGTDGAEGPVSGRRMLAYSWVLVLEGLIDQDFRGETESGGHTCI
jgi:hypothetical protein